MNKNTNHMPIANHVKLSQGLAINALTRHLVSDIQTKKYPHKLLKIASMQSEQYNMYISADVSTSVLACENDIIYTRTGQVGEVFRGFTGVLHNNSFKVELADETFDNDYLEVILKSPFVKKQALQLCSNSMQPDLTHGLFRQIIVPYFPTDLQRKIAKIIKTLDHKIALNNAINAELENTARTLYDYWFTQFDFPDTSGKPYKSSGGEMVWNEQLKREIPKGWEAKQLGCLGTFHNGVNYSKGEGGSTETKIVNVRDISASSTFIDIEKCDVLSLDSKIIDKFTLTADDLLIARSGIPGSVRLIFSTPNKVIYCGFSIRFSLEKKKLKNYILFVLKNIETSTTKRATGSILKNVSQDTLKEYVVVLPQDEVTEKFNVAIEPLFSGVIGMIKENEELTTLRDFLLPLLMNGQVTIGKPQAKKPTKPKSKQIKSTGFDPARFQEWKKQIGIAARGDIDEQTLKNMYEAMDADEK